VIDAGVASVRFLDGGPSLLGPSLRWSLALSDPSTETRISASLVGASNGAGGSLDGGRWWERQLVGPLLLQAGGELSAIVPTGAPSAQSAQLSARLRVPLHSAWGWLRATEDAGARAGTSGTLRGHGLEVGGAGRWSGALVSAAVRDQWSTAQLFADDTRDRPLGTVPVRYTEAEMSLRLDGTPASLSIAAGVRRDPDAPRLIEPAFSATALFWIGADRALTLSMARQLPDFTRGADAAQIFAIGMRWNERSPATVAASSARPRILAVGTGESRELVVIAAGAKQVEVMGDFTEWAVREMVSTTGDRFTVRVTLASGTTHVLIRVDGGAWAPPSNTPAVEDDLGGKVGLLVVP
jgi:hypothetical protein